MAGPGRIVLQLAAQPRHVEAEIAGALLESGPPDCGQELRRPDELAGPVQQDGEDAPFGGRQPQRPRTAVSTARTAVSTARTAVSTARTVSTNQIVSIRNLPDLVCGEVDEPLPDDDLARLVLAEPALVAAQRGAQPGQQLGHRERLGR